MTEGSSASDRGRAVVERLIVAGRQRGLDVVTEYPVVGGRLDVVWLWSPTPPVPGVDRPLPVVAFEVESSWRTRKHLKGDYLNLVDVSAALGVLVLLGEGEEVDSTRRFAQTLVDRPGAQVVVWSEADVDALATVTTPQDAAAYAPDSRLAVNTMEPSSHVGKYRALWQWLSTNPDATVTASFREVEEIVGFPLPPSSRKHAAHWSSYDGSAVARAIHDAGFRASHVDLQAERLSFVRTRR